MEKVTPFLMFQDGKAEEAMNHYISIIDDSEITSIVRYGANENGDEGTVMQATFSLKGQEFILFGKKTPSELCYGQSPTIQVEMNCRQPIN